MDYFVPTHGGILIDLLVDTERVEALKTEPQRLLSITLDQRQISDPERDIPVSAAGWVSG